LTMVEKYVARSRKFLRKIFECLLFPRQTFFFRNGTKQMLSNKCLNSKKKFKIRENSP
jgi:hypothetical protein